MAVFEIMGPDGAVYEVDAPDEAAALKGFQSYIGGQAQQQPAAPQDSPPAAQAAPYELPPVPEYFPPPQVQRGPLGGRLTPKARERLSGNPMAGDEPTRQLLEAQRQYDRAPAGPAKTGLVEQSMSGVNEGIADLLGLPMELSNMIGNAGIGLVNYGLGTSIPQSEAIGGSEDMRRALGFSISDVPPQTDAQRYARSVGHEVGASAVPAAGAGARAGRLALELASATGSGLAAQAARDVAPDSQTAELVATLVGGGMPIAGARALRESPAAPSTAQLRAEAQALYEAGNARAGAAAEDVGALSKAITGRLADMDRITPTGRLLAEGNAKAFTDVLADYDGKSMSPQSMQNVRAYLKDAAASPDAADRRVGTALLGDFDQWRSQLVPEFGDADRLYGRAKRAEDVDWRIEKAENRAATSGTGGNAVNAARQNIRAILDDPKKARGYSAEELAQMKAIVRGDGLTNALRLAGRLSPTSGALPLAGNLAAAGAYGAMGSPLMAVPGIAGMLAKGSAEIRTSRQVRRLSETIRNGTRVAPKSVSRDEREAMRALLVRALINGG